VVPDALRACGVAVELKTDHFPEDTKDTEWLPVVGARGWVILTKDKHLSHNYLEIVQLLQSGTASFILTSGSYTGREMANAFVQALPHIRKVLKKYRVPFIAAVTKAGNVRLKYTFDKLIEKVAQGRRNR